MELAFSSTRMPSPLGVPLVPDHAVPIPSVSLSRFCLFCRNPLAAAGLTAAIPSQPSILRSARRNAWRRRSSQRKRVISTCCPSLASRVPDPRPKPVHPVFRAFTASFSVLPALNTETVEAATDRLSPVRGLRAMRAGRFRVPNVPKPSIRASSPFAKASPITSNTPSTASFAAALFIPVRPARRSANSDLFIRAPCFRLGRQISESNSTSHWRARQPATGSASVVSRQPRNPHQPCPLKR